MCVPCYEQCSVVVRGVTVVLNVLALLPHTEVMEGVSSIEVHIRPLLGNRRPWSESEQESFPLSEYM